MRMIERPRRNARTRNVRQKALRAHVKSRVEVSFFWSLNLLRNSPSPSSGAAAPAFGFSTEITSGGFAKNRNEEDEDEAGPAEAEEEAGVGLLAVPTGAGDEVPREFRCEDDEEDEDDGGLVTAESFGKLEDEVVRRGEVTDRAVEDEAGPVDAWGTDAMNETEVEETEPDCLRLDEDEADVDDALGFGVMNADGGGRLSIRAVGGSDSVRPFIFCRRLNGLIEEAKLLRPAPTPDPEDEEGEPTGNVDEFPNANEVVCSLSCSGGM
jgi:hypothetical protein